MDAKTPAETHLRAMEHTAKNAFAPMNEMINQSRTVFERSLAAMRDETLDLLNRLHDRNGDLLAECQSSPNVTSWAAAQEKWFTDFSREVYQAQIRFHETTRHILADSIESVGHSVRHGAIAHAAEDTAAHADEALEADHAALHEAGDAAREHTDDAIHAAHDAVNEATPDHPEHNV